MSYKMEVQKWLADGRVPEDLTVELGIKVKQHSLYPELYHFSYDQLESPKDNPIVKECRGLILNSKDNWAVVAYPFNRFANHGESWSAEVDWDSVRVQEKVDGSLMVVWFYDGKLVSPTSLDDVQPFLQRMWEHVRVVSSIFLLQKFLHIQQRKGCQPQSIRVEGLLRIFRIPAGNSLDHTGISTRRSASPVTGL